MAEWVSSTVAPVGYLLLPVLGGALVSGIVMRFDLMKALKRPIDGGAHVRGRRLFGANKTWRGLVTFTIGTVAVVAAQKYLVGARAGDIALVDYQAANAVVLGGAMAAAAVAGELPNSFVKRQLNVAPGSPASGAAGVAFYVWDQVDFLVLLWPALVFWVAPTWPLVLTSFALAFVVHQVVSVIGYLIGARRSIR